MGVALAVTSVLMRSAELPIVERQTGVIAPSPDINGDGVADILIAAPYDSRSETESGAWWALSGKDYALIAEVHGKEPWQHLGTAITCARFDSSKPIQIAVSSRNDGTRKPARAVGSVELGELINGTFSVKRRCVGIDKVDQSILHGFGRSMAYNRECTSLIVHGDNGRLWSISVASGEVAELRKPLVQPGLLNNVSVRGGGACTQVDALMYEQRVVLQGYEPDCMTAITAKLSHIRLSSQYSCKLDMWSNSATGSTEYAISLADFDLDSRGGVILIDTHNNFTSELVGSRLNVQHISSLATSSFGCASRFVGDLDGDNLTDVLVGAPGVQRPSTREELVQGGLGDPNGSGVSVTGVALLLSRKDFSVLDIIRSIPDNDASFASVIEELGDLNEDGHCDMAIVSGHWPVGAYAEYPLKIVIYSPHKRRVLAELEVADRLAPKRIR